MYYSLNIYDHCIWSSLKFPFFFLVRQAHDTRPSPMEDFLKKTYNEISSAYKKHHEQERGELERKRKRVEELEGENTELKKQVKKYRAYAQEALKRLNDLCAESISSMETTTQMAKACRNFQRSHNAWKTAVNQQIPYLVNLSNTFPVNLSRMPQYHPDVQRLRAINLEQPRMDTPPLQMTPEQFLDRLETWKCNLPLDQQKEVDNLVRDYKTQKITTPEFTVKISETIKRLKGRVTVDLVEEEEKNSSVQPKDNLTKGVQKADKQEEKKREEEEEEETEEEIIVEEDSEYVPEDNESATESEDLYEDNTSNGAMTPEPRSPTTTKSSSSIDILANIVWQGEHNNSSKSKGYYDPINVDEEKANLTREFGPSFAEQIPKIHVGKFPFGPQELVERVYNSFVVPKGPIPYRFQRTKFEIIPYKYFQNRYRTMNLGIPLQDWIRYRFIPAFYRECYKNGLYSCPKHIHIYEHNGKKLEVNLDVFAKFHGIE